MIHCFIFPPKLHSAQLGTVVKFTYVQMFLMYVFVGASGKALAAELTSELFLTRVHGFVQAQVF